MISATAYSQKTDTKSACREIKEKLLQKTETNSEKDISCILFVSPEHNIQDVLEEFREIDTVGISAIASFTEESIKVKNNEYEDIANEPHNSKFPKISAIAFDRRYIYCETFSVSVPWSNLYDFGRKIGERFSEAAQNSSLILLATPFYEVDEILRGIKDTAGHLSVFGGVSSSPPGYPMFSFENGSVGSYIISGIVLEGIEGVGSVAQSCEIISEYIIITSSYENVIREMDGAPAIEVIQKTYEKMLSEKGEKIVKSPWFIGVEVDEKTGIMRFYPIVDVKPTGITVAGKVKTGSLCKLAVFSEEYAEDSVDQNLIVDDESDFSLFFNCTARYEGLFTERQNYDIEFLSRRVKHPMAGFFSNGEIATINSFGPYLLTYTGVLASFRKQLFA